MSKRLFLLKLKLGMKFFISEIFLSFSNSELCLIQINLRILSARMSTTVSSVTIVFVK